MTLNVIAREAAEVHESPYGSVGVLHEGPDLNAWWIWKDREEIEPDWSTLTREDFLYVVQGSLRLEFRDDPGGTLTIEAGESFVIPAGLAFRGYRWPRDSDDPCLFVAVSPADAVMAKAPVS